MGKSDIRSIRRRVWFHRASSITWIGIGLVSFALGWQSAIALVWAASVYANVKSDWANSEAADDRAILEELRHIRKTQEQILQLLQGEASEENRHPLASRARLAEGGGAIQPE